MFKSFLKKHEIMFMAFIIFLLLLMLNVCACYYRYDLSSTSYYNFSAVNCAKIDIRSPLVSRSQNSLNVIAYMNEWNSNSKPVNIIREDAKPNQNDLNYSKHFKYNSRFNSLVVKCLSSMVLLILIRHIKGLLVIIFQKIGRNFVICMKTITLDCNVTKILKFRQKDIHYQQCNLPSYKTLTISFTTWRREIFICKSSLMNSSNMNAQKLPIQYYFFLLLSQRQQTPQWSCQRQEKQDIKKIRTQQVATSQMIRYPNLPKCFYNCACYCCLNGCCVIANCCCCCSTYLRCNGRINQVSKQHYFSQTLLYIAKVARLVAVRSYQLPKLLCNTAFFAWEQHRHTNINSRLHTQVSVLSTSGGRMITSNGDGKQKTQYSYIAYEIANDQHLKTNNLYKIFCNNHKRQRRRRRRRRRRRCHSNSNSGAGSSKQLLQLQRQQGNVISHKPCQIKIEEFGKTFLSFEAFKSIIATIVISTNGESIVNNTKANFHSCLSRPQPMIQQQKGSIAAATTNPHIRLPKTKRTSRTNLVWLLIGLVWFESPKLINCSAIGNSWNTQHQQLTIKQYESSSSNEPSQIVDFDENDDIAKANNKLYGKKNLPNCTAAKSVNPSFISHFEPVSLFEINLSKGVSKKLGTRHQNTFSKLWNHSNLQLTMSTSTRETNRKNEECSLCHLDIVNYFNSQDKLHTDKKNINYIINNSKYNNQNYNNYNNIALSDRVRLESIKRQILAKLGLSQKPNVSHPLPKQFIWDTIYRADGSFGVRKTFSHDTKLKGVNSNSRWQLLPDSNVFYSKYGKEEYRMTKSKFLEKSVTEVATNSVATRNFSKKLLSRNNNKYKSFNQQYFNNTKIINTLQHQINEEQHFRLHNNNKNFLLKQRIDDTNSNNKQSKLKSKSTYLLDIKSNSDKIRRSGNNDDNRDNDYTYFNDYSVFIDDINDSIELENHQNQRQYELSLNRQNSTEHPEFESESVHSDREDYFGNTQEIITFAEKGTKYRQHRLVEFAAQTHKSYNQRLFVKSAEIHIRIDRLKVESILTPRALGIDYIKSSKQKNRNYSRVHKKLKIWIFQLVNERNSSDKQIFDQIARFCASFEVNVEQIGWKKFDLTSTVRNWYELDFKNRLRLLIDCTGCGNHYRLNLFEHESEVDTLPKFIKEKNQKLNPNRPFLVLHTETKRLRRVRRGAIDCGGALSGQCCKESFYVSFKALGWDDWIIAPRGYFANYCRGECSAPFRTPDTFQTFHAHFIEEYRKMGLLNGMKPCCAPVKFSSMSLIYYGDDGIIKRDLPKMIVDECGCP